ncbi:MAG: response regulator, partial [Nannocystaceae bacterium]
AKLLIVDDQPISRALLIRGINKNGLKDDYEVVEAENGVVGLQCFEANSQIQQMVVDVHMPVMDGLSMLRMMLVRWPDRLRATKIYMVTTEENVSLQRQCESYGVDSWLLKPIDISKFCEHLRRFAA